VFGGSGHLGAAKKARVGKKVERGARALKKISEAPKRGVFPSLSGEGEKHRQKIRVTEHRTKSVLTIWTVQRANDKGSRKKRRMKRKKGGTPYKRRRAAIELTKEHIEG